MCCTVQVHFSYDLYRESSRESSNLCVFCGWHFARKVCTSVFYCIGCLKCVEIVQEVARRFSIIIQEWSNILSLSIKVHTRSSNHTITVLAQMSQIFEEIVQCSQSFHVFCSNTSTPLFMAGMELKWFGISPQALWSILILIFCLKMPL